MNEKEVLQWAIKGIEDEIKNHNKRLKRDLLVMQAYKKGIHNGKFDPARVEKQIADIRNSIELLSRKKAFLIVQLEE
jgi:hypothetical protein